MFPTCLRSWRQCRPQRRWASAAPESGADIVEDGFGQRAPKIMFATDGYFYGGKRFDTLATVREIVRRIPGIAETVIFSYGGDNGKLPDGMLKR